MFFVFFLISIHPESCQGIWVCLDGDFYLSVEKALSNETQAAIVLSCNWSVGLIFVGIEGVVCWLAPCS